MGIISAQWASGKYVAKWEADLAEASGKMRAVDAQREPEQEAKFRQVESKLISEIEPGLPTVR